MIYRVSKWVVFLLHRIPENKNSVSNQSNTNRTAIEQQSMTIGSNRMTSIAIERIDNVLLFLFDCLSIGIGNRFPINRLPIDW